MKISYYFSKMRGGASSPRRENISELLWSWIGALLGVGICGYLSVKLFEPVDSTLLIGSFGSSAVLVYGAIKSPFAQPRNLVGGHVVSAAVGVVCFQLFGETVWLAAALSAAFATVAMLATGTVHPPAGATAMIAVIGGEKIHNLGFMYVLIPVALGALILLIVALTVNNLAKNRRYPEYWI
jgi:CBS-domain-containing membrane protein